MRYGRLLFLVCAPAIVPTNAYAQASSFVCLFDIECTRDTNCETKEMRLTFFVDEQGGAFMQGNIGLVQVMPLAGGDAVSFVQPTESGIVQSTSILSDGSAVHSRHTAILSELVTSQWHGQCSYFGGGN